MSRKKTAYLLEDEDDFRFLCEDWLEELGFEVYSASSVPEMDEVLASAPSPDIACLDKNLRLETVTNSGGIACAIKIRSKHPNTKILLLTGYHDTEVSNYEKHFDLICQKTKIDNTHFNKSDFFEVVQSMGFL